jgi:alpha-soluble NSF attachment protein
MSDIRSPDAFKAYRKTSPEDAARYARSRCSVQLLIRVRRCLQQAIAHYCGKGNFRRAATHQQNLGEVYETEIGDQKRAVEAYETAAGWYESDNAEA